MRRLLDAYNFPGFRPKATIKGILGDPKARVIRLERSQKKRYVDVVEGRTGASTARRYGGFGTFPAGTCGYIRRVLCRGRGKVKQEKFPWLSDNPFYTKRFSY